MLTCIIKAMDRNPDYLVSLAHRGGVNILYNVQTMASNLDVQRASPDPLASINSAMVQRLCVECLFKILSHRDSWASILAHPDSLMSLFAGA